MVDDELEMAIGGSIGETVKTANRILRDEGEIMP